MFVFCGELESNQVQSSEYVPTDRFLGAKVVVAKCVEFFRQHVDEITQLPDFLDQISGIRFDVENVLKENQQTTDSPRGNDFNWVIPILKNLPNSIVTC